MLKCRIKIILPKEVNFNCYCSFQTVAVIHMKTMGPFKNTDPNNSWDSETSLSHDINLRKKKSNNNNKKNTMTTLAALHVPPSGAGPSFACLSNLAKDKAMRLKSYFATYS